MEPSQPASSEATNLYTWLLDKPRLVILLVHGLGEYAGRYEHVARFFNDHGMAVLAADLPGHGRAPGARGHAYGLKHLFQTVDRLMEEAANQYPGVPVVLYGHSMGGNLALNYVLRRRPQVAGVIATSSWIRLPEPPPAAKVVAGRVMRYVWPSLTLPNGLDPTAISRDPEVVRAYQEDPLVHDKISAALGASMLDAAHFLDTWKGEVPVPMLLMHGSEDRLTAWQGSSEFAERAKGPITFQLWEGGYHELHNDLQKEQVLQAILEWLEQQVLQAQ